MSSKMDQNETNKVIQLPKKKVRRALLKRNRQKLHEHQRAVFSGSLLTFILVVSLMNHKIWNKESTNNTARGIASVDNKLFEEELTPWQKSVAERLKVSVESKQAILGDRPQAMDNLRYGELGGSYDVLSKNGKIYKVELAQNRTPTPVKNLTKIVSKYASLFIHDFDKIELIKENKEMNYNMEHYHLTKNGKIQAALRVERDIDNNLLNFYLD